MADEDLCAKCGGKCCRYFALEIDTPTTKRDFDDIRWYLCHENIRVFVEDGEWYLEVNNRCRHLDESSRCRIYPDRPAICRKHSLDNCEGHDEIAFDREHEFENDEEMARFIAERFPTRKGKDKRKKKDKKKGKHKKKDKGKGSKK